MPGFHGIRTEHGTLTTYGTCWCGGKSRSIGDEVVCLDSKFHDPRKATRVADPRPGMTLYVAGPMSNLPDNNYPAFFEAASLLGRAGFTVVNPATYSAPEGQRVGYADLLREDLRRLLDCDGVATLRGWEASHGASNEVRVAQGLYMPVLSVPAWATIGFTRSNTPTEEK